MPHHIVIGNEKGGSGKSTTAMHVATALARLGHKTACLDLDLRQRSLARYLENRAAFMEAEGLVLPTPALTLLSELDPASLPAGDQIEDHRFEGALNAIDKDTDFIVIDCPGSHTRYAQLAHSMANTLITPLNDSFVDFDLLGRVNIDGTKVLGPSVYSEMIWQVRQWRAQAELEPMRWIVVRNRIGAQAMINKRKVTGALKILAKRIGFETVPGFSERVIFRELFPRGLTLLDLADVGGGALSISNIAARQEVRDLLRVLNLPGVEVRF